MDGILREGEQALEGQMGGGNQGSTGGGNMDGGSQGFQGESNMREGNTGGGNMDGGNMDQQSGANQSSGGGFLGGLEKTGENAMIDQGTGLARRLWSPPFPSSFERGPLANIARCRGQSICNQGGCAYGNGRHD
jgi:hypothetical protein